MPDGTARAHGYPEDIALQIARETASGLRAATDLLSRLEVRAVGVDRALEGIITELRGGHTGALATRIAVLEERHESTERKLREQIETCEQMQRESRSRQWQTWI